MHYTGRQGRKSLESSAAGIHAVKIRLLLLRLTSIAQIVVVNISDIWGAGYQYNPQFLGLLDHDVAMDRVRVGS